ncbi:MAG: nitroreductase family protein [Muribaculaceae bacterium]|nr:nitroreductase family protein [Muribaculaceae bacterium]
MIDFDSFRSLLMSDRTVRRFRQDIPVDTDTLRRLVELTRYCASGRNAQPLRYVIINTPEMCAKVFPQLKWAGYYTDWDGPQVGERPAAYLIQCLDTHFGPNCLCDDGLQLQAITLGAETLGLGACIIKAFNAPTLAADLGIDSRYQPRYVLALGQPREKVVIENMDGTDEADFKYFRTPDEVHHVPKRPLDELILTT